MNFEKLRNGLTSLPDRAKQVEGRGEEATKQALVLPFLNAMGYDVWNPTEVMPEYEGDFAIKKLGQKEKVDYAILFVGKPRIFIEVKAVGVDLEGHQGQLARYFNAVPEVPLGILTNGLEYRFFSDTAEPNVMDAKPFFVFRVDVPESGMDVLMRFEKSIFSPENIRELATELHYTTKIMSFLRSELDVRDRELSVNFIRWILANPGMYDSRVTANVVERFRPVAKNALTRVIREIVRRSMAAVDEIVSPTPEAKPLPVVEQLPNPDQTQATESGDSVGKIHTTQAELDSFAHFKKIVEGPSFAARTYYDSVDRKMNPLVAGYRDTTGYFSLYVGRPSFWICRLGFDSRQPWIAFNVSDQLGSQIPPPFGKSFLPATAWAKFRLPLSGPEDISGAYRGILEATINEFLEARKQP